MNADNTFVYTVAIIAIAILAFFGICATYYNAETKMMVEGGYEYRGGEWVKPEAK